MQRATQGILEFSPRAPLPSLPSTRPPRRTETHESGTGSHRHTSTETRGGTVQLLNATAALGGAGRELAPGQYQWQVGRANSAGCWHS